MLDLFGGHGGPNRVKIRSFLGVLFWDALKEAIWEHFGSILDNFWSFFETYLVDLSILWGGFWVHFGCAVSSFFFSGAGAGVDAVALALALCSC